MKIAILGATGMLGHHAALAAISAGHEVTVLHRETSDLSKLSFPPDDSRCISGSSINIMADALANALTDQDAVIHCAGYYPTIPRPWRHDVAIGLKDLEHFYRACEYAYQQGQLQKVVYLGGSIALKHHKSMPQWTKPYGDETCLYTARPASTNAYLQTKWSMNQLSLKWANRGLPISIAMPTMTFGEYDFGPTTGQLITRLANGELKAFVHGNRNVIYAGDAGRGLVRVAEQGAKGQSYLLTGSNTSMQALVDIICDIAKVDKPSVAPLLAAQAISQWQALKYKFTQQLPEISSTAIAVMSAGQHLSGAKAATELDFVSTVTPEQAITKAFNWFKHVGYV